MRPSLLHGAFLLPVFGFALLAEAGQTITTSVETENFSFSLPLDLPTANEVIRALPESETERKNVCIVCELIVYRFGETKSYPLVGSARLVQVHFKCTVYSDAGKEVVYIDHDRLMRSDE